MEILIDSHVVVWWLSAPEKLTAQAREQIANPANRVWVSAASVWELGLKVGKGKLRMPRDFARFLWNGGFEELPISSRHAEVALGLPPLHADPFDRMLIAQAQAEGLVLMTRDHLIARYELPLLGC
ncbi:MAG: type II toxin-antitoxin system VapC family toxin [Verrucomicrobiales bacterium]